MRTGTIYQSTVEFIGNQGDYEEHTECLLNKEKLRDALKEWQDLTTGMHIECSSCPGPHTKHDWLTAYPSPSDVWLYNVTYSLHVEGVTLSSLRRLFRALDAYGVERRTSINP